MEGKSNNVRNLIASAFIQLVSLSIGFYFQVENKDRVTEVLLFVFFAFAFSLWSISIVVGTDLWIDPNYRPRETSTVRWIAIVAIFLATIFEGVMTVSVVHIDGKKDGTNLERNNQLQQAFFITTIVLNGVAFIALLVFQSEHKTWLANNKPLGGRRDVKKLVRKTVEQDLEKRGLLV